MTSEQPTAPGQQPSLRGIAADALRFWERGRIFYNLVLLAIVVSHLLATLPDSWRALDLNLLLFIFVMAVIANVLYCLAYLADVFVQLAGMHRAWTRWRWLLLLIGTITAGIITRAVAIGMFSGGHMD